MNQINAAANAEVKKTLLQLAGDEKALVLLTGDFKHPFKGKSINISGAIAAPFDFYANKAIKNNMFDPKDCRLEIKRSLSKMTLFCGERDEFDTIITGSLVINPALAAFKINTEERWDVKTLTRFLKLKKFFFQDRDACDKMIKTLMGFKAKFEAEIEKSDDLKGNTIDSYVTKLTHELDLSYSLNMPIFIGAEPTLFSVEICVDASEPKQVKFWMESVSLAESQESVRDKYINEQRDKFTDIVVIELV
jgi:hypothetical protein